MKLLHKLGIAAVSVVLGMAASTAQAATIVGNDTINRRHADGWSNFTLTLNSEVFSEAGTVSEWEVYANNPGNLGMLLLRDIGGSQYKVIGADFENAVAGVNKFSFNPDTGSANVEAGDILGLFIGSAKVDFDGGGDSVGWCSNNSCITNFETQLAAGQTISRVGNGGRKYSANVTLADNTQAVPEPASMLGLLAVGAFGTVSTSKRRKRQEA